MRRRDFVGQLGLGAAAFTIPALASTHGPSVPEPPGSNRHGHAGENTEDNDQGNAQGHGGNVNAVVSFGQWSKNVDAAGNPIPLDRFPNLSPRAANNHQVQPFRVTIRRGGSVSFLIGGVHQILVYGPGTQLADVSSAVLEPGVPPLVNDPNGRIYRGLDPRALLPVQDRLETVHFPDRGNFLVVCGVLPHFQEGMHGFVHVA